MAETLTPQIGKFPGVRGPHTARAVERLKTGKPGDLITREQMAAVIGRDCSLGTPGYGNVCSAIRATIRDHQITWQWDIVIKAWRCLTDPEKLTAVNGRIAASQRRAKAGLWIHGTIDASNLTAEQRTDHDVTRAVLGTQYLIGQANARKRLQAIDGPREPNVVKLIELMTPGETG